MNTLIILQYAIERLVCTSGSGSDDLCGDLLHWCDTVVLLLSCMFGRGSKVAEEASRTSMVLKHSREVGDKNKDVTTLEWNREGTLLATGIINNVPFRAKRVAVPLLGYPYQLCRCDVEDTPRWVGTSGLHGMDPGTFGDLGIVYNEAVLSRGKGTGIHRSQFLVYNGVNNELFFPSLACPNLRSVRRRKSPEKNKNNIPWAGRMLCFKHAFPASH